jgi:hypothetical protein
MSGGTIRGRVSEKDTPARAPHSASASNCLSLLTLIVVGGLQLARWPQQSRNMYRLVLKWYIIFLSFFEDRRWRL